MGKKYDGIVFNSTHFRLLAKYQSKLKHNKFFSIHHQQVRFTQYIGVLKIGNLTIEILPKIDQLESSNKDKIQQIVLDLLRYCKVLHLESVPNSNVQLRKHSILDVYLSFFVQEVEKILHFGLFRSYSRYPKNQSVLKGQLLFEKQIQHNYINKTKFYCHPFEYDFNHPFNRIIKAALLVSKKLSSNYYTQQKINSLLQSIPLEVKPYHAKTDFLALQKDKNTHKYQLAISYAKIILEQLAGNFQTGNHAVIGLFFDMNLLYEKFVYTSLKKLESENFRVYRQVQKHFWGNRKIRPDIVFAIGKKRYVLDTKWKMLRNKQPSIEDLKQVFVYCNYFDATEGILLYPQIPNKEKVLQESYHPYAQQSQIVSCKILELSLIKNNKLNKEIGKDVLATLVQ